MHTRTEQLLGSDAVKRLGVSREHLLIRLDANRVVIVDNHSANGTRLNGERIEPNQPYIVRHGDAIQLGLLKLQIELLSNSYF